MHDLAADKMLSSFKAGDLVELQPGYRFYYALWDDQPGIRSMIRGGAGIVTESGGDACEVLTSENCKELIQVSHLKLV